MVPPVRTEKRLEKRVVDGVEREVEVEVRIASQEALPLPRQGSSLELFPSPPAPFSPTPCIVSNHHLHRIALSRILYPHPPPTFFPSSPPYPTDNVASNDGTPGSYELLTTSPRPDLYALLSASCTLFATTLSFVVARIRYRPRLTSAASSPRHIKLVQCLVQNVLYPCPVLVVSPFSPIVHFVCVIGPSSSSLSPLVATPSGNGGRLFVSFCITLFVILFIPSDCIYRVGFSLAVMKRLTVVLFGFWRLTVPVHYE
jgi:hypothetical protein